MKKQKTKGLRIALNAASPFAFEERGGIKGFEVDLWEEIASDLHVDFSYHPTAFKDVFDDVRLKRYDLALGALTVEEHREEVVDFSHHTYDSGLDIMVHKEKKHLFRNVVSKVFRKDLKPLWVFLVGFVIVVSHLYWFFEQGHSVSTNYFVGIFESLWWLIVSVTAVGYGDIAPHGLAGRVLASIVILFGVVFIGALLGRITSLLTIETYLGDIRSPKDLANRKVATVKLSSSEYFLDSVGAKIIKTETIEQAYKLLYKQEVDAILYDAPILQHHLATHPTAPFLLLDQPFQEQSYAFALPEYSPLRESINRKILKMRDDGRYDKIYKKWFG